MDDEPQMRRFLRATLPSRGFRLVEAASGEEALSEAAARRPDLVLLDLGLPDMDGQKVIAGLREWSRVPVLVLSARRSEPDKVQAFNAGADDYLTKPFCIDELLARMHVALRHARAQDSGSSEPTFEVGHLEEEPACPRYLLTETGVGYRLAVE